ncbi:biotin/lipoyl-containing protein [Thermoclostridium caenicola]|uniref:Biotin-requiring enzyme n=1 Tax=Thermoclostridium caenicola TaxID=659425 RepID=A0A1M6JPT4_9FIRM|nr:biotin/lipoyl-containing protein [Thermoclostridium caenicola]SHJ48731.1 Biotin-requiring enzyme [Thermoclostridium caenicola]
MKYIVTLNGKNYEVEVERGQATVLKVEQAPAAPVAAPAPAPAAPAPAAVQPAPQAANVAGEPIKAPMPGTILSIKVTPGAAVKKGDVVVILEAMKMENEIFAPRDGTVAQVVTTQGASVNTGDVLLTLN